MTVTISWDDLSFNQETVIDFAPDHQGIGIEDIHRTLNGGEDEIFFTFEQGVIPMFTQKSKYLHVHMSILSGLLFVLLLITFSFLVTRPASGAPLPQSTPTATPAATAPVTSTVSARCGRCVAWPTSDIRLDIASGSQADIEPLRVDGLQDIPIVRQFGVADNGNILPGPAGGYKLRYNWSYGPQSCDGYRDTDLTITQANFITSYNPTFFDSTVIDSATQYRQFLPFFQARNPNTLIGYYHSALTCLEDTTSPYLENYYPLNAIDCHRLVHPISPSTPISVAMNTQPWTKEYCWDRPTRWYVNVSKSEIITRFCDNLLLTVRAIKPTPSFIFLDNVVYIKPEFAWVKGNLLKDVDCRERAFRGDAQCNCYQKGGNDINVSYGNGITTTAVVTCTSKGLIDQLGPDIYFDDLIKHYRALIASLEQEGIRTVLNVGTAGDLAYPQDASKFAHQFEQAIGKNGINFERPFAIALRTNAGDTANEIKLHQRLLKDDKLVIFGEYTNEAQSTWLAAMAMLIREPGQSLFVMRDYGRTNWIDWPIQYGSPTAKASFDPIIIDGRESVGHNWVMQRQFLSLGVTREITAVHFGVNLQAMKTFTVTLLAPDLSKEPYDLLYGNPQLGDWDEATGVYTATHRSNPNGSVQADYFILGAQCDDQRKFCKKLIAVSVGVFK